MVCPDLCILCRVASESHALWAVFPPTAVLDLEEHLQARITNLEAREIDRPSFKTAKVLLGDRDEFLISLLQKGDERLNINEVLWLQGQVGHARNASNASEVSDA